MPKSARESQTIRTNTSEACTTLRGPAPRGLIWNIFFLLSIGGSTVEYLRRDGRIKRGGNRVRHTSGVLLRLGSQFHLSHLSVGMEFRSFVRHGARTFQAVSDAKRVRPKTAGAVLLQKSKARSPSEQLFSVDEAELKDRYQHHVDAIMGNNSPIYRGRLRPSSSPVFFSKTQSIRRFGVPAHSRMSAAAVTTPEQSNDFSIIEEISSGQKGRQYTFNNKSCCKYLATNLRILR